MKIKEIKEEEEPGEEERNSDEDAVPDGDLNDARDSNDNSGDPDYQVQNDDEDDDDDNDKCELRKDLKHEEVSDNLRFDDTQRQRCHQHAHDSHRQNWVLWQQVVLTLCPGTGHKT